MPVPIRPPPDLKTKQNGRLRKRERERGRESIGIVAAPVK